MTLFEGNLPQKRERERAREREREKEKESERVGCQMIWELQKTGHHRFGFARSVNVDNRICLVCAKFHGLSCMVPGYRFWGVPIALQCFVHISDKKNSRNTKVVFNHYCDPYV